MEVDSSAIKATAIPSELLGRTPRRVRLSGAGWYIGLGSTAMLLLAAYFMAKIAGAGLTASTAWWAFLRLPGILMIVGFGFVWRFPLQYRVAVYGLPASASIVTPEPPVGPSRGTHWESYTFRDAQGELQYGRCPMDVWLKPGSCVRVLYLPNNPTRSHIYPLDYFEIEQ